ncbi:MAG: hypothetical protein LBF09_02675, partial [Odoribacteraceae bacterium]|nr:hypothetical protein [Odoribacteraceae bacterium]
MFRTRFTARFPVDLVVVLLPPGGAPASRLREQEFVASCHLVVIVNEAGHVRVVGEAEQHGRRVDPVEHHAKAL